MSASAQSLSSRAYIALSVFCLAVSAIYISETSVAIALEDIAGNFGASMTATAWVATIYVLMVGTFVPIAPTVGERIGYKRTFLVAYILFSLGSIISGCSPNLSILLLGRMVQGIGGSLVAPASMRLVGGIFPKELLPKATGVMAGCAGAGLAIGPALAGFLLDNFNWHSIFWVNVLLGFIIVPAAYFLIDESHKPYPVTFDWWGIALIATTSSSILLALANGNAAWNTGGWSSPFILSMFGCFIVSLTLLIIRELRFKAPAILLSLFKEMNYSIAGFCILVVGFGMLGAGFILPVFMQKYLGYTKFNSGITFGPGGICQFFIAMHVAQITKRFGIFTPLIPGFFITCISFWVAAELSLQSSFFMLTLISLFRGIGLGLIITPLFSLAASSIPTDKLAYGTAAFYYLYQFGMSVGVALFETLMIRRTIFHTAVLAEAVDPKSPRYMEVFHRINTSITERGTAMPSIQEGQAHTIIQGHLKKVAYAASVGDVMLIAFWLTLASAILLLLYKLISHLKA